MKRKIIVLALLLLSGMLFGETLKVGETSRYWPAKVEIFRSSGVYNKVWVTRIMPTGKITDGKEYYEVDLEAESFVGQTYPITFTYYLKVGDLIELVDYNSNVLSGFNMTEMFEVTDLSPNMCEIKPF